MSHLPPLGTNLNFDEENVHRNSMARRPIVLGRDASVSGHGIQNMLPQYGMGTSHAQSLDDKLAEQFRYFRREFMEAAVNSGATIPLDMVEDKNGHLYTFVKTNGPKYIFQIMQNNIKSVHLLRCSLSLIIITITLLRRKCAEATKKPTHGVGRHNQHAISVWAAESLAKIVDSGTVSICIQILIKSSNPSVQELALNLLAFLLPSSSNAIELMLLPPSTTKEGGQEKSFDTEPDRKATVRQSFDHLKLIGNGSNSQETKPKSKPNKKATDKNLDSSCLSYILSVALLQKNRHLLLAGCADVILAMLSTNPADLCEPIASTSTCPLPALDEQNTSANTQKNTKKDYSLQQQAPVQVPTNPLANRVIDWAGLKILLKFLFRYQKISHRSSADTLMRDSVSASLRLKEEYLYTHQRVLTAVCSLIAGSPAVAAYAYSLPGAEDLLIISSAVHHPLNPPLKNVIDAALFAMKLERKQRRTNLTEIAANTPKNRRSSNALNSPMPMASSNGSIMSRPSIMDVSLSSKSSLSPPKPKPVGNIVTERRTKNIQLMPNISVNFTSEYAVNTDKSRLYAEKNQMLRKGDGAIKYQPNSDMLISNSLNAIDKHTMRPIAETPVVLQDYRQHYSSKQQSGDLDLDREGSHLQASTSIPSNGASYNPSQTQQEDSDVDSAGEKSKTRSQASLPAPAAVSPAKESSKLPPSAHRDFFGQLPAIPQVPERIEPASVIDHTEDMRQIREKFAAIAAEAIKKISQKGDDHIALLVNY